MVYKQLVDTEVRVVTRSIDQQCIRLERGALWLDRDSDNDEGLVNGDRPLMNKYYLLTAAKRVYWRGMSTLRVTWPVIIQLFVSLSRSRRVTTSQEP